MMHHSAVRPAETGAPWMLVAPMHIARPLASSRPMFGALAMVAAMTIAVPAAVGSDADSDRFGPPAPGTDDSIGFEQDPAIDGALSPRVAVAVSPRRVFVETDAASEPASVGAFEVCRLPDVGTGESTIDPACAFDVLQRRYVGFQDHREHGRLVEEIDLGDDVVRRTETEFDCLVRDGRFVVETTARQIRGLFGRMIPVRTSPAVEEAARELDQWIAPHAILDPEQERTMDPTAADAVRIDDRDLIRVELAGGGDRIELFVNPDTVVVERALGERSLPDGGQWRGELELEVVGTLAPALGVGAESELGLDRRADESVAPRTDRDPEAIGFDRVGTTRR